MRAVCSSLTFKAQSPDSILLPSEEKVRKQRTSDYGVRDPLREKTLPVLSAGTRSARKPAPRRHAPVPAAVCENVPPLNQPLDFSARDVLIRGARPSMGPSKAAAADAGGDPPARDRERLARVFTPPLCTSDAHSRPLLPHARHSWQKQTSAFVFGAGSALGLFREAWKPCPSSV